MYKFTFTIRATDSYGCYWGDKSNMTISVIAKNRQDAINKAYDISGYEYLQVVGGMTVTPCKEDEVN